MIGQFIGRMKVYSIESIFWLDLVRSGGSSDMVKVYMKYIAMLKDQWTFLTYMGLVQILATLIFYLIFQRNQKRSAKIIKS